ncbi:DUF305 domain-containing protein [Serinicoccus kebangsaanensis]|uniref:DUF305 domain-containing protein n=1 Tax=Serinicoccus kebangsaanensis TaxID=2602069 RepID=UPI001EE1A00C|nr:DUF305 domain-containing protein [Serinicoccus kebangsaanensis]
MTERPTPAEPSEEATETTPLDAPRPARDRWRSFGAPALAAVTVVALCLGALVGWLAFGEPSPPDDGADAGFARDMSEHHAQAVQMSQLVMQRTEDEAVRRLAVDISNNQGFERGMMATWLRDWGLPLARGEERMAWMSMEGMDHAEMMDLPAGVPMPGMASPTEIQELGDASGEDAEVLFLQLMTTHHISGVDMADAALAQATQPEVLAAAQRMVTAQVGEIRLMQDMLVERDAEPREDIDAWVAEQEATDPAGSDDGSAPSPGSGGHDH